MLKTVHAYSNLATLHANKTSMGMVRLGPLLWIDLPVNKFIPGASTN